MGVQGELLQCTYSIKGYLRFIVSVISITYKRLFTSYVTHFYIVPPSTRYSCSGIVYLSFLCCLNLRTLSKGFWMFDYSG